MHTSAHERRAVLIAFAVGALIGLGVTWNTARAAKVTVAVTTASEYEDGTSVAAIAQVRITWGPCIAGAVNGGAAGEQASIQGQTVLKLAGAQQTPGEVITLDAFPVGLDPVCLLAYNSDAAGNESSPTNTLVFSPLGSVGKPVALGQPITLPPGGGGSSSSSSSSSSAASKPYVFYCPAGNGSSGQPYANCRAWTCGNAVPGTALVTPNAATNPLTPWGYVQPSDEVPVCGLVNGAPSTQAPVTWQTKQSTGIP